MFRFWQDLRRILATDRREARRVVMADVNKVRKSEAEWAEQLTPQQYQSLVLDVRKTIGINAYSQKDYGTAIEVFETIAKDETLPDGVTLNAEEWKQRCQWAQNRFQTHVK